MTRQVAAAKENVQPAILIEDFFENVKNCPPKYITEQYPCLIDFRRFIFLGSDYPEIKCGIRQQKLKRIVLQGRSYGNNGSTLKKICLSG